MMEVMPLRPYQAQSSLPSLWPCVVPASFASLAPFLRWPPAEHVRMNTYILQGPAVKLTSCLLCSFKGLFTYATLSWNFVL